MAANIVPHVEGRPKQQTARGNSLARKLSNIRSHLMDPLKGCYNFNEKKKPEDGFNMALRSTSSDTKSSLNTNDDSRPLRSFFDADDNQPLYNCRLKRKITINELGRKVVLLFITSLEIPKEEYTVIHQIYQEKMAYPFSNESQYEIVWVPIEETWTDENYNLFESLKQQMYWYTVHHPKVLLPVASRYCRYIDDPENWQFSKKSICVVLDTEGKVVHKNAIPMICIWGSVAFPFSETKERFLWDKETWRMDLLVDSIDIRLTTWMESRRHVCLFGGEDIDWIRKFTKNAKEAARKSGIPLELLYLAGGSMLKDHMNLMNQIIQNENLGSTINWGCMRYFWLRIENMFYSRGKLLEGKNEDINTDPIMQRIVEMLSFDTGTEGWAVISRGSLEMTMGSAEYVLTAMTEHEKWSPHIGFVAALEKYLIGLRRVHRIPHHCPRLILPATETVFTDVLCAECGRLLERSTFFSCCTDNELIF